MLHRFKIMTAKNTTIGIKIHGWKPRLVFIQSVKLAVHNGPYEEFAFFRHNGRPKGRRINMRGIG